MNIRLMLEWLEYIFKFSFINGFLGGKSALLQRFTADFAFSRDRFAHFEQSAKYTSRCKILSNPVS